MNNSLYLCYVKMIDAAIRRQAPDENGGDIKGSTLFFFKKRIICLSE